MTEAGTPLPIPLLVGLPRSGTTLLRMMLDAHPELAIPAETMFIPDAAKAWRESAEPLAAALRVMSEHPAWITLGVELTELEARLASAPPAQFGDVLRVLLGMYAEQHRKPRWGEKSANHLMHLPLLAALLPEGRFVHLIRDGRDVFMSIRNLWFGPSTPEAAARWWRDQIETARQQAPQGYLEVRFEQLVTAPERTLRPVCEFVSLPWNAAVLRYHERAVARLEEIRHDLVSPAGTTVPAEQVVAISARTGEALDPARIFRWRTEMTRAEQSRFAAIAGDLLERLGYPAS